MILLPHAKRIAHDSGRGMGLPGLYSGPFYSVRQAARRGLQQGGDCVRRLFKLLVIRAYLLDLLPARTVVLAFRLFDLKHE